MNVDASYNICDLSSVNNFSTIRGKSAVYTNSIDITNQNNILTLSSMSKLIYSKDVNYLEKSNTTFLSKYLSTYKKINILE